jgi:hypothetical protein
LPFPIFFYHISLGLKAHLAIRRFQVTGTPMAKILRLHLSAQCALREITILYNFVIEKVEKHISLQRFRDLKTLFQNCFKVVSKLFQNRKNVYEAKFLTPSPQIFRLLLDPIVLKI